MPPITILPDAWSRLGVIPRVPEPGTHRLIMYSVDLPSRSSNHPFGRDTFIRREDAERFIEELRKVEPEFASSLRVEERELEAGGLN
jgi:hypothetical protein